MMNELPFLAGTITRQISAENPTGEKGGACHWVPDPKNPQLYHSAPACNLGKGWKVRPFIRVEAGETVVLADIEGQGIISEIFFTSDYPRLSELVLRMYWDDETEPSVEVPAGAFFCIGHDDQPHTVNSIPVTVAPYRGCNCYWRMPFRKHARITLTHEGREDANIVAWRVLYHLVSVSDNTAYFHAQFRHTLTSADRPEHIILDGVKGKGNYVGTYLAWNNLSSGWWGEGEVKFYLDGDEEYPTLCDNGTEDYFGGAWNFGYNFPERDSAEQPFSSPWLGLPLALSKNMHGPKKFSMYRWHVLDSIGFEDSVRVTIQTLGWYPDHTYRPLGEDIFSVAYFYQMEPHQRFPELPGLWERWER